MHLKCILFLNHSFLTMLTKFMSLTLILYQISIWLISLVLSKDVIIDSYYYFDNSKIVYYTF